MNCSPPAASGHGISQSNILQQVPISFSRGSSQPRDQTCLPCIGRQILYHWVMRKKKYCASHVALVKNPPANAGKVGLILGLGTSSGGGNGNALLYSWRYQVVVTKIILKKKKYRKAKLFIEEGLQIARKDEKQNAKEKENAITN